MVVKRKIAQHINEVPYASNLSSRGLEEIYRRELALELEDLAPHFRVKVRCHEIQENFLTLYWKCFSHGLHLFDGRFSQLQSMPGDESYILNDLVVDLLDARPVSEVFDDVLLAVVNSDQRGLVELANQRNDARCHVNLGELQVAADVFAGLVEANAGEVKEFCAAADVKDFEFVVWQACINRAEV